MPLVNNQSLFTPVLGTAGVVVTTAALTDVILLGKDFEFENYYKLFGMGCLVGVGFWWMMPPAKYVSHEAVTNSETDPDIDPTYLTQLQLEARQVENEKQENVQDKYGASAASKGLSDSNKAF